jgi:hypothetical protein
MKKELGCAMLGSMLLLTGCTTQAHSTGQVVETARATEIVATSEAQPGTAVVVNEFDGTGYRQGGRMEIVVQPPMPGDPAQLYFSEIPAGLKMVVVPISIRQIDGTPYYRNPAFAARTDADAYLDPQMMQIAGIDSGPLRAGERRTGLIAFVTGENERLVSLVWEDDLGAQQAAWTFG